ncbi:hypothetical protein HOD38_03900 [archaeon]|jgi:hypothetical protein|nr:hypothetical protein [archaeon]MBT4397385.1 hypothetical protein [archaeon]MBT4440765.1 hypothetical protein [archaeon]
MVDLQELVANYQLAQPAIAFAGGALLGLGTRVFQSFTPTERVKEGRKEYWLPASSVVFGFATAKAVEASNEIVAASAVGALVGNYIATSAADRFIYGKW